jgi:uncharacterized repeat protein (TIGR03943 family)
MSHHRFRWFQILITMGLGFFLFERISSGKLLWYINARFTLLVFVGMLLLFALAGNALEMMRRKRRARFAQQAADDHDHETPGGHAHEEHEHSRSAWGLAWLCLPLALGLLIPARPLGASLAANKGIAVSAPLAASDGQSNPFELESTRRTIMDWMRLFNYENELASFLGQPADVIGFVYHDPRLQEGQFLVSRFTVSCCVADAFAIGMVVSWPQANLLTADQWVRVTGGVQLLELDGRRVPLIQAQQVEIVSQPDQPYLFP